MKRVQHLKDGFRHMLFDRHPRTESSRIRRGIEHDRDHLAPRNTLVQRLANLGHHGDIENIERWPRKRDPRDAVSYVEFDVLKIHSRWYIRSQVLTSPFLPVGISLNQPSAACD